MNAKTGMLYLVGTPIGNLEDITLRALRVLGEVDIVAAEDTRVTRRLLERYELKKRLMSYHEHSGPRRLGELVEALKAGKQVALVSDAGMPGISDPGARLVEACAEAGIEMAVIPGPTAPASALAISGVPTREFLFLGFLPSRAAARRKALERVAGQEGVIVCFEAPHRLRESLEDIREVLGDREAACARELTKRFEEVVRGRVSDLIEHFAEQEPRGEMTLVLAGARETGEVDLSEALEEVRELVEAGLARGRAVAHVARRRGVPRSKLYRAALGDGEAEE